jgi:hypothetical protein
MSRTSTAEEIKARPTVSVKTDTEGKPLFKSLFDLKPPTDFQSDGFKNLLKDLTEKDYEEI